MAEENQNTAKIESEDVSNDQSSADSEVFVYDKSMLVIVVMSVILVVLLCGMFVWYFMALSTIDEPQFVPQPSDDLSAETESVEESEKDNIPSQADDDISVGTAIDAGSDILTAEEIQNIQALEELDAEPEMPEEVSVQKDDDSSSIGVSEEAIESVNSIVETSYVAPEANEEVAPEVREAQLGELDSSLDGFDPADFQ